LYNLGCTSAIEASLMACGLHKLCTAKVGKSFELTKFSGHKYRLENTLQTIFNALTATLATTVINNANCHEWRMNYHYRGVKLRQSRSPRDTTKGADTGHDEGTAGDTTRGGGQGE